MHGYTDLMFQYPRADMAHILAAILIASANLFEDMRPEDMERAFWDCDYAATYGVIDLDVAAGCSDIYERLKEEKFGGDFRRVLLWWQENRDNEISSRKLLRQLERRQ